MEFKGTKGEWEVSHIGIRKNIHDVKYLSIDSEKEIGCIDVFADMRKENHEEELYADAQLIATAPGLLKALQDLVRYCDEWDCHADLQFAEETINKALGK